MLTYLVRERKYLKLIDKKFSFPAEAEIIYIFHPLQPFGKKAGGGKTTVRGAGASTIFETNTGHHWIESKKPLKPLDVKIVEPNRIVTLEGNELHIKSKFNNLDDLDNELQSVYFAFPMLLNLEFADPPVVKRVYGTIGDIPFRWELKLWPMVNQITTQDLQEEHVFNSWNRFNIITASNNRRLIAAIHYFHVACRLSRAGNSPWEFMSEIILNFSKTLEALFPPKVGEGGTIESARKGLAEIGFSGEEFEACFIPAIALRNKIDSGHVFLSVFTKKQLRIIHSYIEYAEPVFQQMLLRIFEKIESGEFKLTPYTNLEPDEGAIDIVKRMDRNHDKLESYTDRIMKKITK